MFFSIPVGKHRKMADIPESTLQRNIRNICETIFIVVLWCRDSELCLESRKLKINIWQS